MEWILLLAVAIATAAYIGWPHTPPEQSEDDEVATLRDRRTVLLTELRDFDTDLANGRISDEDRHAGRRALAPELREVTERLRALGHCSPATPQSSN